MTPFVIIVVLFATTIVVAALLGTQAIGPAEYRRRLGSMLKLWPIDQSFTLVGATHTSTTVDGLGTIAPIEVGMTITGAGIPAATTVTAVGPTAGTITISNAATATAAGVTFTFAWVASSAEVHLFAAPFSGPIDPGPSDFTEATFDGYAAITIASFAGPYSLQGGSAEVDFGNFSWVLLATPTVGNTIYGYWVDYLYPAGGATRVVSVWEAFPTPLAMNADGDAVVFSLPINLPLPGSVTQP